jgi:hypothetical protein
MEQAPPSLFDVLTAAILSVFSWGADVPVASPTTEALATVIDLQAGQDRLTVAPNGLAEVGIHDDPFGAGPLVRLSLGPSAATRLAEITQAHIGGSMDVFICGDLVLSARIVEPILAGDLVVSGTNTQAEAESLIRVLNGEIGCAAARASGLLDFNQ